MKRIVLIIFIVLACSFFGANYERNKLLENFTFVQLKYDGGNWDPNPTAWEYLRAYIVSVTNIHPEKERKMVSLKGLEIFDNPFLVINGDSAFKEFSPEEIENLKRFFDGGGVCFIDDASGILGSGFDTSIRREFKKVFPLLDFYKIGDDHAINFSFHLTPQIVGTKANIKYLEGIDYNGQTAVVYSHNDLLGVWLTDELGNPLKKCIPGGESQRIEAEKLTINIFMYELTGTYKLDAVHQSEIQRKLKLK